MEKKSFHTFVCYETFTGDELAIDIANCLEKRFGARAFVAARPGDIPPGCPDEQRYRYDAIRDSRYMLLLATNGILGSEEVQNELKIAEESNVRVIIFPRAQLRIDKFRELFPKLKDAQRQPAWKTGTELANEVCDWFLSIPSPEVAPEVAAQDETIIETGLIVHPKWLPQWISKDSPKGRITFDISNNAGNAVQLHGYRMFRVAPTGEKDFYYEGISVDASDYTIWAYDRIFRIVLRERDRHIFYWGEVDIPRTYGINRAGVWTTEVVVAYFKQGASTLHLARGVCKIEFR